MLSLAECQENSCVLVEAPRMIGVCLEVFLSHFDSSTKFINNQTILTTS